MICNKCGQEVAYGLRFCTNCGNEIKNKPQNSSSIVLGDGEKRIKSYYCTKFVRPSAKGYLTVTNKRVIFHSEGHDTEAYDDIHIDNISGVSTSYGKTISFMKIFLAIIFSFIAIGSLVVGNITKNSFFQQNRGIGSQYILSMLIFGGLAAFLFIKNKNQYFTFSILSGSSQPAIQIYSSTDGGFARKIIGAFISTNPVPTPITPNMAKELGALIMDVKTLGDHAIQKWSPNSNTSQGIKNTGTNDYINKYFD